MSSKSGSSRDTIAQRQHQQHWHMVTNTHTKTHGHLSQEGHVNMGHPVRAAPEVRVHGCVCVCVHTHTPLA